MTGVQILWAVLIAAQIVVALLFAFLIDHKRRTQVPVLPEFQAPLAELEAALVSVSQSAVTLKNTAANAPSAQDLADTVAAVQAQADAAKALAVGIAPTPVSAPVIS
jgi:hypothetical protein